MKKNIIPLLMFFLLGLNFIFTSGIPLLVAYFNWGSQNQFQVVYIVLIGSYLCLISLVWFEKDDLKNFNIEKLSIILFIFVGIVRPIAHIPGELYYRLIIFILSIVLLILMIKNVNQIPKTNGRWIGISLMAIILIIPLAYIDSFEIIKYNGSNLNLNTLPLIVYKKILENLSFVSPFEELLFRSLLWGYLKRWGLSENKIFWCQGFLFWFIHVLNISSPISFYIIIPIGTLIMSYIVRHSKQIFPSIIFHTALNAFLPFLALYF